MQQEMFAFDTSALSLPSNNCKLGGYGFYLAIFRQFSNQILIHLLEQKSSGQIVLFAVDDICTHCPELIFPG